MSAWDHARRLERAGRYADAADAYAVAADEVEEGSHDPQVLRMLRFRRRGVLALAWALPLGSIDDAPPLLVLEIPDEQRIRSLLRDGPIAVRYFDLRHSDVQRREGPSAEPRTFVVTIGDRGDLLVRVHEDRVHPVSILSGPPGLVNEARRLGC